MAHNIRSAQSYTKWPIKNNFTFQAIYYMLEPKLICLVFRSNALTLGNLLKPQHISKFTDYGHVMRFIFQTIPNVSAIWADGPKKIVWYLSYFGYTFCHCESLTQYGPIKNGRIKNQHSDFEKNKEPVVRILGLKNRFTF